MRAIFYCPVAENKSPFYSHDDRLRKVSEIFAEKIEPAAVYRVFFYPDLEADGAACMQL